MTIYTYDFWKWQEPVDYIDNMWYISLDMFEDAEFVFVNSFINAFVYAV